MNPRVTVVVTARERFSMAQESLASLLADPGCPMRVIYMDTGSPAALSRHLAATPGIEVIRTPDFMAPNRARNLALDRVDTPYVVFVDNDVVFKPGWLRLLVECADATGATLVNPLVCIGVPHHTEVHLLGGVTRIVEENGRRVIKVHPARQGVLVKDAGLPDHPYADELVEFHTVLVRTDHFRQHGKLDENLLTFCEETDLSLQVQATGGTIFFEPRAVVTYDFPRSFALSDLPWFLLRWSDRWLVQSLEHIERKWQVARSPAFDRLVRGNGWQRRQLIFRPLARLVPAGRFKDMCKAVLHRLERLVVGAWSATQS